MTYDRNKRVRHSDVEHMIQVNGGGGTSQIQDVSLHSSELLPRNVAGGLEEDSSGVNSCLRLCDPDLSCDWMVVQNNREEIRKLEDEKAALKKDNNSLKQQLEQWGKHNDDRNIEIENLQRRLNKAEQNFEKEKEEHNKTKEELKILQLSRTGPDDQENMVDLEKKNAWLEDENKMLSQQVEYVQERLREAETELQTRPPLKEKSPWSCDHCTYTNSKDASVCEMCHYKVPRKVQKSEKLECDGTKKAGSLDTSVGNLLWTMAPPYLMFEKQFS